MLVILPLATGKVRNVKTKEGRTERHHPGRKTQHHEKLMSLKHTWISYFVKLKLLHHPVNKLVQIFSIWSVKLLLCGILCKKKNRINEIKIILLIFTFQINRKLCYCYRISWLGWCWFKLVSTGVADISKPSLRWSILHVRAPLISLALHNVPAWAGQSHSGHYKWRDST